MNQEKENFTLSSLLSHLICYRKLILFGTVAMSVLLVAINFIYSRIASDSEIVHIEYNLKFNELPPQVYSLLYSDNSNKVKSIALDGLASPQMISSVLVRHNVFEFQSSGATSSNFNMNIKNMINNSFVIRQTQLTNSAVIVATVLEKNIPECDAFVSDFVGEIDSAVCVSYHSQLVVLKSNTDTTIKRIREDIDTKTDMSYYQELQSLSVQLETYLADKHSYVDVGKSFVITSKSSAVTRLVVILFASFISFILVSFIVDYFKTNFKRE